MVFDEPTAGLDPRSRRDVWNLINAFREERRVVVFSTQYLEEADLLCDRVYLVDGGSVVAWGAPADLKRTVGNARLRVRVNAPPTQALEAFREELPLVSGTVEGDHLVFTWEGTTDLALDVLRVARTGDSASMRSSCANRASTTSSCTTPDGFSNPNH